MNVLYILFLNITYTSTIFLFYNLFLLNKQYFFFNLCENKIGRREYRRYGRTLDVREKVNFEH